MESEKIEICPGVFFTKELSDKYSLSYNLFKNTQYPFDVYENNNHYIIIPDINIIHQKDVYVVTMYDRQNLQSFPQHTFSLSTYSVVDFVKLQIANGYYLLNRTKLSVEEAVPLLAINKLRRVAVSGNYMLTLLNLAVDDLLEYAKDVKEGFKPLSANTEQNDSEFKPLHEEYQYRLKVLREYIMLLEQDHRSLIDRLMHISKYLTLINTCSNEANDLALIGRKS